MTRTGWSDIGFRKNGAASGVLKGLLLGCACFAVSYAAEFAILAVQGIPAHFELYISGFRSSARESVTPALSSSCCA